MDLKRNWIREKVDFKEMPSLQEGLLSTDTPRLFTYVVSHDLYSEGGKKSHLTKVENDIDSKTLCGIFKPFSVTMEINLKWLSQPDPDDEVCIKCKKIAKNILREVQ